MNVKFGGRIFFRRLTSFSESFWSNQASHIFCRHMMKNSHSSKGFLSFHIACCPKVEQPAFSSLLDPFQFDFLYFTSLVLITDNLQMLDFYTSCMDTSTMDNDDDENDTLKKTVGEILGAENKADAIKIVAQQSINVFYQLYVEPDNANPDINSIYVSKLSKISEKY